MFSHVRFFVTLQTAARQAPLGSNPLGKNTGVGCHFLLQGIFLAQGLNPCLLKFLLWQVDSLPLRHLGSFTRDTQLSFTSLLKLHLLHNVFLGPSSELPPDSARISFVVFITLYGDCFFSSSKPIWCDLEKCAVFHPSE